MLFVQSGSRLFAASIVHHRPGWMITDQSALIRTLQELEQLFAVDESAALRWRGDLVISGERSLPGTLHYPGPDHVQIDLHHASGQLHDRTHGCRMVAVFPKDPLAIFSPIVLLGGSGDN